jgi:hypothetical protein
MFGVSSHEYMNYAEQNRKEWEANGRSVVQELIMEAQAQTYDNVSSVASADTLGTQTV